ncbi:MAG: hypothetical protein R6X02_34025 [Enhygromyxa sp.]
MSNRQLHTRREALRLLGALIASGAATGLAGCKRRAANDVVVATRTHAEAAKTLGVAWLEQNGKASAKELAARFLGGASLADYDNKPDELRALLHQRIRQDFAEGRTARLDGWLMSTTELDVYAYVAVLV